MIWIRTGCLDSKKSTSSSVFHDGGRRVGTRSIFGVGPSGIGSNPIRVATK